MSSRSGSARLSDSYATIGFALKRAQHALRSRLDTGLREIGLTTPQYAVLVSLEVEPGASNAELARRAFVTPQTMQAILVALVRAGYIVRKPHAEHGRVQTTELTAKGCEALKAASEIAFDAERRIRKAAAPLDPNSVAAMLLRLADALG